MMGALEGWWEVTWRGTKYYYFYKRTGRVSYTQRRPANTRQPLHAPVAEGYWFDQGGRNYVICWTPTGSVEKFTLDAAGTSRRTVERRRKPRCGEAVAGGSVSA